MPKENPAPRGGGDRASNGFAWPASFTRRSEENQAFSRRRHVERLYRLGARAVYELLDEIGRHHGIVADVDRRLARFAALDPQILATVGGDRFPAAPMRVVQP
jgi:hypothetical protein